MTVLAIDPGPTESAYVAWDGTTIQFKGKVDNQDLLVQLPYIDKLGVDRCVIEMIASYGMPVGAEIFETCVWIGRFMEAFGPLRVDRITRNAVKNHLCHSSRAKDSNIRQALIDRFGAPGTKKAQGLLYGVSGDAWAALAVAVTWTDQHEAPDRPPHRTVIAVMVRRWGQAVHRRAVDTLTTT